jgi:5-methylcytosine-specific restriction endonuclease McrA
MAGRDQTQYNQLYYRRNREREIARVQVRQDATRDLLRRLRARPCADCGRDFKAHQMDFDHLDPRSKSFRLTSGRAMLAPLPRLLSEVDKCEVLCANCHRIRTWVRHAATREPASGGSRYLVRKRMTWRVQARLLDDLKAVPCADCGAHFPACAMDFDHRVGTSKRLAVSRLIGRAGTAAILAEVAKCDIVCANCHRDRTFRRRGQSSGRE